MTLIGNITDYNIVYKIRGQISINVDDDVYDIWDDVWIQVWFEVGNRINDHGIFVLD